MHVPRPACWLVDYAVCDQEILVLFASPDGTLGSTNKCSEFSVAELLFIIKSYIM